MYRQTVNDPTQTTERERFPLKRAGKWQRGESKSQKKGGSQFFRTQTNKQNLYIT